MSPNYSFNQRVTFSNTGWYCATLQTRVKLAEISQFITFAKTVAAGHELAAEPVLFELIQFLVYPVIEGHALWLMAVALAIASRAGLVWAVWPG